MPPPGQAGAGAVPIDNIIAMRQQGYSNNQIVSMLQNQGFAMQQIFDAMSQADLKAQPAGPVPNYFVEEQSQPQQQQEETQEYAPTEDTEKTEELIESIIDEKWEEFTKNINKVIEWKNKTEARIITMEQQFNDLKNDFNKLHQAIIGKIGEYDQNILNVGVEIKAMEKVFQKVLPTLNESVNELSRITKNMKDIKKQAGK